MRPLSSGNASCAGFCSADFSASRTCWAASRSLIDSSLSKISKHRLARSDIAARAKHNHLAVAVLRPENQKLAREAGNVLRREITDAHDKRADQRRRFVIGDLRARPHHAIRSDIDADFPRWIARLVVRF